MPDLVIVAAALLDGTGRVLAARRSYPDELAGQWEFPGGKLEAGESEPAGLRRECREELGVEVRVGILVGETPVPVGRLRLWTAEITSGTPLPVEHSELRWVGAADLDGLDWLAPDRPLLAPLAVHLRRGVPDAPGQGQR